MHSYDACSDPYVAADSRGRFFYTCVGFDIASNDSLAFVVPSLPGNGGSYFDRVPLPEGLQPPYTGREHIIAEDNRAAASYDAPKVTADHFVNSPNRDNVYFTWTIFDFTCGPDQDQFCDSPIWGSMSTDHGFTWSTPEVVSGSNAAVCTMGNVFNPALDPAACNDRARARADHLPRPAVRDEVEAVQRLIAHGRMFPCECTQTTISLSRGVVMTDARSGSASGVPRNTRQRNEVLALLDEESGFRTPYQLHMLLVTRGANVGLTTVYRTLQRLLEAGEVDVTRLPSGEQLFRRCNRDQHHHHLVCRSCGATIEVRGPAVEQWADHIAAQHGYVDLSHTLEIFGTCSRCAA